jgi:predicted SnoaL-like aldol condensation-catalyzing enzyme
MVLPDPTSWSEPFRLILEGFLLLTKRTLLVSNKNLVGQAAGELFGDRDPSAVDRWVSPGYRRHSSLAADGPEALRNLVASLPADFRYEGARVIADGEHVALHGTYHGFGPVPLVAFDLFRVEDGKLAEHWDVIAPIPTDLPHDNGLF